MMDFVRLNRSQASINAIRLRVNGIPPTLSLIESKGPNQTQENQDSNALLKRTSLHLSSGIASFKAFSLRVERTALTDPSA